MMNQNEKLELIRKMQNDSGMEMSCDDLEKLLEEELGKSESEMDTELVAELLELLEESQADLQSGYEQTGYAQSVAKLEPDLAVKQAKAASWKRLEKQLKARQLKSAVHGMGRWLIHAAAVIVALLALSYGMFSTAQAFDWKFLLRLFEPVAETFHLYSNNQPEKMVPSVANGQTKYTEADSEYQTVTYATYDELPDTYHGYAVKPGWLPERFSYLQGSSYDDGNLASITVVYSAKNEKCILSMTCFSDSDTIVGFDLEKNKDKNSAKYIAGYPVTFYYNTENSTLSASWINDDAHYTMTGTLTEEEMIRAIEQLYEKQ